MIVGDQIGEVIGESGDWRPSDLDVSGETADRWAGARPVRKPSDRCLNSVDERGAEARSLSVVPRLPRPRTLTWPLRRIGPAGSTSEVVARSISDRLPGLTNILAREGSAGP